ncbi:MAG: hypothetical protein F6K65_35560 [Moorea sp. SIO3C2]|nr:hypothetical protein [Moorena sp. SIO3C2]
MGDDFNCVEWASCPLSIFLEWASCRLSIFVEWASCRLSIFSRFFPIPHSPL